jgi:hypothetical protein
MSYAELLERLQALRAQTRALEQQVERQARSMSPLTLDDEREMSNIQSRLDHAYRAANRMAPPPLPCERPAFHRRLLDGLRVYSDTWRGKDISQVTDRPRCGLSRTSWRTRRESADLPTACGTARSKQSRRRAAGGLDSGAKRNALKRSGVERPFQARQSRLGRAS